MASPKVGSPITAWQFSTGSCEFTIVERNPRRSSMISSRSRRFSALNRTAGEALGTEPGPEGVGRSAQCTFFGIRMLYGAMVTLIAGLVFLVLADVKMDFDTWALEPISSFRNECEGASGRSSSAQSIQHRCVAAIRKTMLQANVLESMTALAGASGKITCTRAAHEMSDEALWQRFGEWSRKEMRAFSGARSATMLSLHAFVREEFSCT